MLIQTVAGSTRDELIDVTLPPGNYLIIVDGYYAAIESPFTLDMSCVTLPTNTATLDLKVFLQGALKSGIPFPVMETKLRANSLVPTTAPGTSGTPETYFLKYAI